MRGDAQRRRFANDAACNGIPVGAIVASTSHPGLREAWRSRVRTGDVTEATPYDITWAGTGARPYETGAGTGACPYYAAC